MSKLMMPGRHLVASTHELACKRLDDAIVGNLPALVLVVDWSTEGRAQHLLVADHVTVGSLKREDEPGLRVAAPAAPPTATILRHGPAYQTRTPPRRVIAISPTMLS